MPDWWWFPTCAWLSSLVPPLAIPLSSWLDTALSSNVVHFDGLLAHFLPLTESTLSQPYSASYTWGPHSNVQYPIVLHKRPLR